MPSKAIASLLAAQTQEALRLTQNALNVPSAPNKVQSAVGLISGVVESIQSGSFDTT
jgi:hypothetical protein